MPKRLKITVKKRKLADYDHDAANSDVTVKLESILANESFRLFGQAVNMVRLHGSVCSSNQW